MAPRFIPTIPEGVDNSVYDLFGPNRVKGKDSNQPIALGTAKTPLSFGRSECNRVKVCLTVQRNNSLALASLFSTAEAEKP